MRTAPLLAAGLLCALAASAGAQRTKQSAEIGTSLGVTILSASGNSVTHIGVPGQGIQAQPTIYATIFAAPELMVEPQLAFSSLSASGSTTTAVGLSLQLGTLLTPAERNSGYVAANVGLESLSSGGLSASGGAVGAAAGYRFRVGTGLALRLEAHYRRWLGDFDRLNEFAFGLGVGGII